LRFPIDLYSIRFWAAFFVALLVVGPIRAASARKWAFALVNLGFLALHLEVKPHLIAVVGGVILAWLVLRLAGTHRASGPALGLGGAAVLALFVLHKRPGIDEGLGAQRIEPMLALIGFSYVALRLVDVARAVAEGRGPAPDLPSTINYLLPFHMLAAGPIQSYEEFADQPAVPPPLGVGGVLAGLERIAAGLTKKFVLANFSERVFLTGFHAGGPYFLVEMQWNFLWLYLDFSAYSDVAVGVGRLLGVATPENFNRPYLARNVIEFWERWHISLSLFIRRHIFFPVQMGLMRWTDGRSPLLCASMAFAASFLLCGLWHQINLIWLAWGAFQASGLIACNLYRASLTKRLGRKGLNRYLANPGIRLLATALTFEFSALAVVIVTYPFEELAWWPRY
jgi:D-alanyl-lipoteichoic acid acyltransferase DltB (MBOAT superfamily)